MYFWWYLSNYLVKGSNPALSAYNVVDKKAHIWMIPNPSFSKNSTQILCISHLICPRLVSSLSFPLSLPLSLSLPWKKNCKSLPTYPEIFSILNGIYGRVDPPDIEKYMMERKPRKLLNSNKWSHKFETFFFLSHKVLLNWRLSLIVGHKMLRIEPQSHIDG